MKLFGQGQYSCRLREGGILLNSLLAILLMTTAAAGATGACSRTSISPYHPVSKSINDLRLLTQLSEELMTDNDRTIIISLTCVGEEVECESIFAKFNRENNTIVSLNENINEGVIEIQYKTSGIDALSAAVSWMEYSAADLDRFELRGIWNVGVEGWKKDGKPLSSLLDPILLYISAYEVDMYQDDERFFTNYYSGLFHGSLININGEDVNLQCNANYLSEFNQWKITFGTPMLLHIHHSMALQLIGW